jgi:hypothetical protein
MAESLLGTYLKDRRTRLDPAAFGFSAERRRTPGLRREEVARFCQSSRQNRRNEQYADKPGDRAVMICCAQPNTHTSKLQNSLRWRQS